MARRVHGNFKSLLQRLPDSVAAELRDELNQTGKRVLSRARSLAPVYEGPSRKGRVPGTLRGSLSARVLDKALKLKVGIVGKPAAKKAFYARFVEFGHRIGTKGSRLEKLSPITARGTARRLILARRRRDVRKFGVRPHPFLYTFTREELYAPFRKLWGRAVHAAAAGAENE